MVFLYNHLRMNIILIIILNFINEINQISDNGYCTYNLSSLIADELGHQYGLTEHLMFIYLMLKVILKKRVVIDLLMMMV